jgi:hypothetical protein
VKDELKLLCQTLRTEGVKRAMFDPVSGAPTLLEFFDAAGGLPTDEERATAIGSASSDVTTGHEKALDLLITGGARPDEKEASS